MAPDSYPTRRKVLQTSAATIGSGALLSLAGCTALGGGGGDFKKWLVSPRSLDTQHYRTYYIDTPSLVDDRSEFDREFYDNTVSTVEDFISTPQLRAEDFDWAMFALTGLTGFSVAAGDFDVEDVTANLRRDEYRSAQEYDNYELYTSEDSQAVGVTGNTIVSAFVDSPQRLLKEAIDTNNGEYDRYHDVSDDFETLTNVLGEGTLTVATTHDAVEETDEESGDFENQVAYGAKYEVNGETTDVTAVLVFIDERDIYPREIERWTRSDSFPRATDIDVSEDGNVVTVSGEMPTYEVEGTLIL